MKLFEIINEKLASFVFTKESVKRLSIMLNTNKLILQDFPAGDKVYYILHTSATRKSLIDPGDRIVSIIQLNGEKLNAEVKAKNVKHYLNDKNKGLGNDLFSDERIIPNADRFIEQISILIQGEDILPVSELKEIETACKKMNIPLYFYNNTGDFVNNKRQNKISLQTPDYNYKRKHFSSIPESIKAFMYFQRHDNLARIPDKYSKYLNDLVIDQKRSNFIKRIQRDMKGIGQNPLGNKLLGDLFQKEGTDSMDVIIKATAEKWKAIINKSHKNQSK